MGIAVVLLAAGRGERLGAGVPKALVQVDGKSLLEHALERVSEFSPDQIVVTIPATHVQQFTEIIKSISPKADIVVGSESRQGSAKNALAVVRTEQVLIHDAARAFASSELFSRVAAGLSESHRCVIPVLPVTDTIKQVSQSQVVATLERASLARVQTPQGFYRSDLEAAYSQSTHEFTDDAGLLESRGFGVFTVVGEEAALKVTTPADLPLAIDLASEPFHYGHSPLRTGVGTDAHRFGESGELMLGCLAWPDLPKLEGHSDGDAMAHAIVDALLSAAGLGDIGSNFGTDRVEYSGASGELFIRGALDLIASAGYRPVNVAVQVVADRPKIGPRRDQIQERLGALLTVPVSVSATTTDGLGFLSDARGVGCVATALLTRAG